MSGTEAGDTGSITVGDRLEPLIKRPIDRVQLVKYAGASGDFNRIHLEEDFARAGGYPGVIAQGMLSMGFVGEHVAARFGPTKVRRLGVRFKAVTHPGETVTCHAEVVGLREEGGRRVADLKVWAETRPGHVTVEGTATVELR